jgi:hypothetical protein
LRTGVLLVILVFAVTLAVIVGARMSTEAVAVIVGVVCGAAAGIPVSLLILLVSNRRSRQMDDEMHHPAGRAAYPPVVVIQGGTPAQERLPPAYYPTNAATYQPSERQFRLIGDYDGDGGAA